MQGMGGEYLGYIKHPSWNGHYGYNIMPLLCNMASPLPEVALAAAQWPRQLGRMFTNWDKWNCLHWKWQQQLLKWIQLLQWMLTNCDRWPCLHWKWHGLLKRTRQLRPMLPKKISTRTWTWITWRWTKKMTFLCHLALMASPKRKRTNHEGTGWMDEWFGVVWWWSLHRQCQQLVATSCWSNI